MNFENTLVACLEANLKIIFLVLIGVLLTVHGKLDERGVSDLGAITYNVALPALIFTNVATSFGPHDLAALWVLPVSAVFYVAAGFSVASILVNIFKLRKEEINPVICAIMFGNCGSLTIGLTVSLAETAIRDAENLEAFKREAIGYIAIFLLGQNLAMFTWGEHLLNNSSTHRHQHAAMCHQKHEADSGGNVESNNAFNNSIGGNIDSSSSAVISTETAAGERGELLISSGLPPSQETKLYGTAGTSPNVGRNNPVSGPMAERSSIRERRQQHASMVNLGAVPLKRETALPLEDIKRAVSHLALDTQALVSEDALGKSSIAKNIVSTKFLFGTSNANNNETVSQSMQAEFFGEDYMMHLEGDLRAQGGSTTNLILVRPPWVDKVQNAVRVVRRVLSSPPLMAAFAGLIVAFLPPLKKLLFGVDAPLRALTGALALCGKMQVPASMIMLSGAGTIRVMENLKLPNKCETEGNNGSSASAKSSATVPLSSPSPITLEATNLADATIHSSSSVPPSSSSKESLRNLFQFSSGARAIILFGRSATMGLVGYGWYKLMVALNLYPARGLLPFVIFLEAVVPSAQNVVMLLLVHGDVSQGHAMAVAILEQYAICLPFLTLYLVYFIMLSKPFDKFGF